MAYTPKSDGVAAQLSPQIALEGQASSMPATTDQSSTDSGNDRLNFSTLFTYNQSVFSLGMVGVLLHIYLAMFVTDVLLIAPAVWGSIYALVRLWDAVSDPLMGYLTDRTKSRWGRRRPWMFAVALPMATAVYLLWSPPQSLDPYWLVVWMGLSILLFETSMTVFLIPHGAMGVELTQDYHERTRLFGYTHIFSTMGTFLGIYAYTLILDAEDPRALVSQLSIIGAAAVFISFIFISTRLRERKEYQNRQTVSLLKSFKDLIKNRHARVLLLVTAIENLGVTSLLVLVPYLTQYVLLDAEYAVVMIIGYMVPQPFLTPLWIMMSKRIQKKTLWMCAMVVSACAFMGMFFITAETAYLVYILPPILGLAAGVGAVCEPAIKADVIDYDEYVTGERKEGAYFAVWNFVRKGASAIPPFFALMALDWSGYVPNGTQSETTLLMINIFSGLLPACCFIIGAIVFARFSFNREEYAKVREEINQREMNARDDSQNHQKSGHESRL